MTYSDNRCGIEYENHLFPPGKKRHKRSKHAALCSCYFSFLGCLIFGDKQWGMDVFVCFWVFLNIVTLRFMATGKVYLFMFSFLPEEFQSFVGNLPTHFAVNTSVVEHLWRMDANLLQRYRQLETSSNQLLTRARRTANKLFSLSKRCRKQPKMIQQRPR